MQKILSPNRPYFSSSKKPRDGKHTHVLMDGCNIVMRRLKELLTAAIATKK